MYPNFNNMEIIKQHQKFEKIISGLDELLMFIKGFDISSSSLQENDNRFASSFGRNGANPIFNMYWSLERPTVHWLSSRSVWSRTSFLARKSHFFTMPADILPNTWKTHVFSKRYGVVWLLVRRDHRVVVFEKWVQQRCYSRWEEAAECYRSCFGINPKIWTSRTIILTGRCYMSQWRRNKDFARSWSSKGSNPKTIT